MRRGATTAGFLVLLPLLCLAGCWRTCYVSEKDLARYHTAERISSTPDEPERLRAIDCPTVRTVTHPEAEPREISLAECVALAVQNGRSGTDGIRVLAYDPASAATDIEQSLSKFDARWRTSMVWNTVDEPVAEGLASLLTTAPSYTTNTAQFRTDLVKPLPTGGVAGITFNTDYQITSLIAPINPTYEPRLGFVFEQPLLQGFGVEVNQVRTAHPGSIQESTPFGGSGVPSILMTRLVRDEVAARFRARVEDMVYGVEEAYWNLYFSYWDLYSREAVMIQALKAWQIAKARYDHHDFRIQDLAQIEAQYQTFRLQRLQVLGNGVGAPGVLEAERLLRYRIGLPPEDGTRLVPSDTPTLAAVEPDWQTALAEALEHRPDVVLARKDVTAARLELRRVRDFLLPDLRFYSNYAIHSLGSRLDGSSEDGAFHELGANRFHDWTLGLRLDVPIGFREAHAQTRKAELELARRLLVLEDQQTQAAFALQRSYRQLVQLHREFRIQAARRRATATQYQALYTEYLAGFGAGNTNVLLEAQRNWAAALHDEQESVARYNIALADFEHQKGTLLEYDNIGIAEGPLPKGAKEQAAEHIRERDHALILRQRADPGMHPDATAGVPPFLPQMIEPPDRAVEPLPPSDAEGPARLPLPNPVPDE
jgi:outer membrane protein TolC